MAVPTGIGAENKTSRPLTVNVIARVGRNLTLTVPAIGVWAIVTLSVTVALTSCPIWVMTLAKLGEQILCEIPPVIRASSMEIVP